MKHCSKFCRKYFSDGAQPHFVDDDKKTLVARRESELEAACTCGLSPLQKSSTIATIDSAETSYSLGGSQLNTSPRTAKSKYDLLRERTLSGTGSAARETLEEMTLDSHPDSACTAKNSCRSCLDRKNSHGSIIDEYRFTPSYKSVQKEHQALLEREPSISHQRPLQIKTETKTQQPLVLPQEREKHNVPSEVHEYFTRSVETVKPPVSMKIWLRLAIWWLVKSRSIFDLLAQSEIKRRGTDTSQQPSRWHSTVSAGQAFTDLLKGSWILEEVVLVRTSDEDLSYLSIRKMIKDLSVSLHNDFQERRKVDPNFESFEICSLLKYDLHLLESFEQTVEAEESIPAAIDDPDSAYRWFEIDQDNAGMQNEKVLFRTFVNAQLGKRSNRSKSPSAPYMLLLWTAADSCDMFTSLCNHRGSVNLSRKITAGDLEKYEAGDDPTFFSIKFPAQEAEIKFLSPQDAAGFFTQPLVFFAALKQIKPRPGELAIHQTTLSTYSEPFPLALREEVRPSNMASSATSACGLRVYESTPDKCWKTTRRLVINTPPDSTKPECVSYWLPADQIKMVVEGTKVTVRWSDCGRLIKKELGNRLFHYSYIYKADDPNRKIDLDFRSPSDAQGFKKCLLLPTEMPPQMTTKLVIPSTFQDIRICQLEDVDEPDQRYHSMALTKKNPKGPHITEIYYAYRDLDWILSYKNGTPSIIDFPILQTSHYVSTMPRLQGMPNESDPIPEFSDVESNFRKAHFELGCDHDLRRFMHCLTGWTLKFFRPLSKLHLVETGHLLMNPKEQYKGVYVQLWEKAAEEGPPRMQLAVRLGEETMVPWMTASLLNARCRSEHASMSYNVEFPTLLLKRGVEIDTKHMTATTRGGTKEDPTKRKQWKMTLTFVNTERKCIFPVERQLIADSA